MDISAAVGVSNVIVGITIVFRAAVPASIWTSAAVWVSMA